MRTKFFIICFFVSLFSLAQPNTVSQSSFLQKAADKLKQTPNFSADFKLYLGQNIFEGKILSLGEKYYIKMDFIEKMYDGKKVYNIMQDDKEISVEEPGETNLGFNSLSEIIKNFQTSYTAKTDIRQPLGGGKTAQYIRLEPKDKKSATDYILVGIIDKTYELHKIIEMSKDGQTSTFEIKTINPNTVKDTSIFVFDEAKWKQKGFYISK